MAKASGKVGDEANLFKKIIEREKIRSTGIGGGIGKITHGMIHTKRNRAISEPINRNNEVHS